MSSNPTQQFTFQFRDELFRGLAGEETLKARHRLPALKWLRFTPEQALYLLLLFCRDFWFSAQE